MLDARIMGEFVGDEVMLTQILTNLVGNAEKFTDRGTIQIIAKVKEQIATISWIEFSVIDTGIGIPEDKLTLVFQKFRQINAQGHKYKGTGLGLAICKELIEIQGGTISVESQLGRGSVFIFVLPFGKPSMNTNPLGHGEPIKSDVEELSVGRVLVAEDNQMNQKYIGSLLTKWGVSYVMVANGKQVVEEAKRQSFDLILMDIQMPIMDGHEATVAIRNLQNANQNVPIIALTASAMLTHKNVALRAGMNDFLPKPFDPGQLLAILHQYTSGEARDRMPTPVFELDQKQLADLYGSDKAAASDILRAFLTDIVPEFDTLSALCSQRNWAELERLIHKLKPTLSMVGLSELEEKMDHLERNIFQKKRYDLIYIYCAEIAKCVHEALPLLERELHELS